MTATFPRHYGAADVAALSVLLLVMGAFRVAAIRFSPPRSTHATDA